MGEKQDASEGCVLDVILVCLKSDEEYAEHLRTVLQILKEKELYVKLSKC